MACGDIDEGHEADCNDLPAGGTRAIDYVFNYDDVLELEKDVNGRITNIVLKEGKFGYKFTGLGNSFQKGEDFARAATTGIANFKHKGSLIIYSRAQEMKNLVTKLGNGRFVIVQLNRGDDDDSIELAGEEVGVELVAGEIRNAYANGGFFVLNWATPEGDTENELAPMRTVFDTSREETITMLEALTPGS
jgi:hypothetical protein